MLMTAPGATLLALVTFLGFYWLIPGVLALARVFVDRSVPRIWSVLIGIVKPQMISNPPAVEWERSSWAYSTS
jgi:uncharacterized membrane protein HdeD (DUF308 family)